MLVLTLFVAIFGFLVFLFLVKKIFTSIDPGSVVPSRVKRALDTLTEGVLLIDNKGIDPVRQYNVPDSHRYPGKGTDWEAGSEPGLEEH